MFWLFLALLAVAVWYGLRLLKESVGVSRSIFRD